MNWKTRKAIKADEPRIRELFIEMLQTIYSTDDVEGYEDGYLDNFFNDNEDWICVAEVNGSVAAYLSIEVHHEEENFIYLDDLSVSSKYRSHGIGTSLIKTAEKFAHTQNIPAIVFHVEESNTGARKLYKRLGYSAMDEEKTRFRMIKRFPKKDLECIYCDAKFSVMIHANFTVSCPCCKRHVYMECEYGYGPVTPCQIYLGEEIVGVIESEENNYYLKMNGQKIQLNQTYMNAISEAEELVKSRLNISRPSENVNILTKGGSLCFYGDWFGRPCDNYHKILHTSYDGEILEIIFDQHQHLLVYQPEGITSTEQELEITKAQKVKWLFIPYGSKTTKYNTITYTYNPESKTVSKETKFGTEHLRIKEPFCAVCMA